MLKPSDILSLRVRIKKDGEYHDGYALGERFLNKKILILERNYKSVTDLDIDLAISENREFIVQVIEDWGELYEKHRPKL